MDAETLARAVEPFFSTKGVGKGTGLGLSMVFGLAQQSGGALRLESVPSSGTTARLWLPVASETTRPSGRTPNIITQASGPAKILFVDDDLLIAGSTVDLLEDLGHQVIEAHSAIEALRLLEDGLAADLLITDHAMPGMTGNLTRKLNLPRRSPTSCRMEGMVSECRSAAGVHLPGRRIRSCTFRRPARAPWKTGAAAFRRAGSVGRHRVRTRPRGWRRC